MVIDFETKPCLKDQGVSLSLQTLFKGVMIFWHLAANKTSQVKMPAMIERCVRKQNIQYMHNKNQFSLEYFQFMRKLLTCNAPYVQPLQGQDKLVSVRKQNFTEILSV